MHHLPSFPVLYAVESSMKPPSPHSAGISFRSVDAGFAVRWLPETTIIIDDLEDHFGLIEERGYDSPRPPRDFDCWGY